MLCPSRQTKAAAKVSLVDEMGARHTTTDTPARRALMRTVRTAASLYGALRSSRALLNDGAGCTKVSINDHLNAIMVAAEGANENHIILHFHGGAYCAGSVWLTRELVGRLSVATQAHILSVSYRLAPENPFPAALEDALTAWKWVRQQYPTASIAVAGDSAGGNLAFALLVKLAQLEEVQPVACVTMSPWLLLDQDGMHLANQGHEGKAVGFGISLDHWSSASGRCVERYCQSHPATDPLVSPVLAKEELVQRFPPILIHVAEDEPPHLVADARNMASLCVRSGVIADLHLYPESRHVFQVDANNKNSKDSLEKMGAFLDRFWQPQHR